MNKDDVIRHLTRHVLDKKQAKTSVDKVFEIIKHGLNWYRQTAEMLQSKTSC